MIGTQTVHFANIPSNLIICYLLGHVFHAFHNTTYYLNHFWCQYLQTFPITLICNFVAYVNFCRKLLLGHLLPKYGHLNMEKTQKDNSNPEKISHFLLFSSWFLLLPNIGGRYLNFIFSCQSFKLFAMSSFMTLFITLWHQLPVWENIFCILFSNLGCFYPHLTLTSFLLENGLQTCLHYLNITDLIQILVIHIC